MRVLRGFVLLFSLLALLAASKVFAIGSLYTYTVNEYPIQFEGCDQYAADLGRRLVEETGVTLHSTRCDPPAYEGQGVTLEVTYSADAPLPKGINVRDVSEGGYGSYAACYADLQNQIKIFRQATGNEPFLAFCNNYGALRIDSLKSSKVSRHSFFAHLGLSVLDPFREDPLLSNPAGMAQDIASVIERQGAIVSRSTIYYDYLRAEMVLYYYSETALSLGIAKYPTFPSQETCLAKAAETETFFGLSGTTPLYYFCAQGKSGYWPQSSLYTIGLQRIGQTSFGELVMNWEAAPNHYQGFSSCDNDRVRMIEIYRNTLHRTTHGAMCHLANRDRNLYEMRVFVEP